MTDVSIQETRDTVSATTTVDASPAEVFDFLRRPANHPAITGDNSVTGPTKGPETLSAGDKFGMNMRIVVPYRIGSRVVEFDADRLLAWSHIVGHTCRWEVEPAEGGRAKVTETFDLSTAKAAFCFERLVFQPSTPTTSGGQ